MSPIDFSNLDPHELHETMSEKPSVYALLSKHPDEVISAFKNEDPLLLDYLCQSSNVKDLIKSLSFNESNSFYGSAALVIIGDDDIACVRNIILTNMELLSMYIQMLDELKLSRNWLVVFDKHFKSSSEVSELFDTDIEDETGRMQPLGAKLVKKMITSHLFNSEITDFLVETIVLNEFDPYPWYKQFAPSLYLCLMDRIVILSKDTTQSKMIDAERICYILEQVAKREQHSPIQKFLASKTFVEVIIPILFSPDAHYIGGSLIRVYLFLTEKIFNSLGDYETQDLPPLLSQLLVPLSNGKTPIEILKFRLENATLQYSAHSLGLYRLSLVKLVNLIVQSNYGFMISYLLKQGIFDTLFRLMEQYPRNTTLHCHVTDILSNLLYCDNLDHILDWLKLSKFPENLLGWIESRIDNLEDNLVPHYMNMVHRLNESDSLIVNFLHEVPNWCTFIQSTLKCHLDKTTSWDMSHMKLKSFEF